MGTPTNSGARYNSGKPQRYPYEENYIPETPAEELEITRMHYNMCHTVHSRWLIDGELQLPDKSKILGTSGLIVGLGKNMEKTNSRHTCTFTLIVPQGESK